MLPQSDQKLTGEGAGGWCTDRGDGMASFEDKGTLVVIFEGLPITKERPRGIDSLSAMDIRTVDLLDGLRAFGKDLED